MPIKVETKSKSTSDSNETGPEVVISPSKEMMAMAGKIAGIVSLVAGCLAMFFALMPFCVGWFAAIFWVLYPCAFLSLAAAIPAFFFRGKWRPIIGLCLSVTAFIIALLFGRAYVLAMADSVNGLTNIAKAFVDALTWPF